MMDRRRVRMEEPGPNARAQVGEGGWLRAGDGGFVVEWDGGGRSRYPGEGDVIRDAPEDAPSVCDFCGRPAPRWEFAARDVTAYTAIEPAMNASMEVASRGAWQACGGCRSLVEQRSWDALAERAAENFIKVYDVEPELAEAAVAPAHGAFRRGWTGGNARALSLDDLLGGSRG